MGYLFSELPTDRTPFGIDISAGARVYRGDTISDASIERMSHKMAKRKDRDGELGRLGIGKKRRKAEGVKSPRVSFEGG